ncbi:52 kDa repressor of the inhibitor of the protein kinase-like [Sycon ciliatum]|uniref:52 kDa repressor of the inhibitor of the protein kinase-like n=1 Tax=Sycon ciliatum TaxID=27933 RepID=UPI0031F6D0A0
MPCQTVKDKSRKDGVRLRYCNRSWFDTFPFTAYSAVKRGIYCVPCVLFPVTQSTSGRARILISTPLVNFKDATQELAAHRSLDYHLSSEAKMDSFLKTMRTPGSRIDATISQQAAARVKENRAKLFSIVKCLEFCGRNGLALRGHRDDGDALDDSWKQGNFKSLVNFRVEAGDDVLRRHLETASVRETYISKTSQNALLSCIGHYVREQIAADVRASGFYAVSADEVADVSNWEQLGVVLRYIKDGQVLERLAGFVALEKVRGCDIFQAIKTFLADLHVDMTLCRAQAYDGVGAMAGELRGCQALFKDEIPQATYYHSTSHQLNLALSKACSVPEVLRMVATMKQLGLFFKYSPKKQRAFEEAVDTINRQRKAERKPEIAKAKFKMLCETRWIERHTAFEDFHDMMEPLSSTLEVISQPALQQDVKWDAKSVTDACGLLRDIRSSEYLIAFHVCRYFFGFTKDIARLLQGSSMDVFTAYTEIADVRECIKSARLNSDERFADIFREAEQSVDKMGADDLRIPRRCATQRHRSNLPATTPEEFWRRSVFVPFADSLLQELKARFNQITETAVSGLCLLPENAVLPCGISEDIVSKLQEAFATDLPAAYSLPQEVDRWVRKWKKVEAGNLPKSLADTLSAVDKMSFPNISCILKLLLIAPVISASVERANSALAYVKTDLRSSMGQSRLNDLLLLYVHKDIKLDYNKIVDMFATRAPRRMQFVDPCNHDEDEY